MERAAVKPPALSRDSALFLDFDGTLVDIAARPEQVQIPSGLPQLLRDCSNFLNGAVAIVSGRKLSDIDHFLQPLRLAGAGLHGAEIRRTPDSDIESTSALDLAAAADSVRAELAAMPGLLIEHKGAALAVHYRASPQHGPAVERALHRAVGGLEVEIIAGKFVFEARPHGVDKAAALRELIADAPFAGRTPVFVGDDVTDEDGMRAAQARGGFGIKVGIGESVARHRLRDPQAVAAWLRQALGA